MLPAADKMENRNNVPPRIIVQHGFTANANKARVQSIAYMLRSMGFTVIVNNLRDRCGSGHTTYRKAAWGYDFPYDVLGAWDYAVKDPDNLMGGEVSPDRVALYGQSMGAFATATAFGLESLVPGAFLDSFPLSPARGIVPGIAAQMGWGVATLFMPVGSGSPAWYGAKAYAGVNCDLHTPMKTLPLGPDTQRKLGVSATKQDRTVAYSDTLYLLSKLSGPLSKKYILTESLITEQACGASDHVVAMFSHPNEYRSTLCSFYAGVFQLDASYCGLDALPSLQ
jgi:hypothetical protein